MAKKREVNYFKEISCDEELEKFLSEKGLIVLDVYQDLFGPTISLQGTLQKVKLSLTSSDKLQLGVCDAYKVDKLKRFKNKCLPTMIFCSHGKVVEIVYGSNIPLLLRALHNQLEKEDLCETDNTMLESRDFYDFDEPLPFEVEEIERKRAEEDTKIKAENERLEIALHEKLDGVIELFKSNAGEMGVTVFMPHVAKDAYKKTLETSKWLGLISRARHIAKIDANAMRILNYKLENPMPDEILERIYEKDIFVVLWQNDNGNESIEKVLDEFVRNVSEPHLSENTMDEEIVPGILQPRILDPLIIYLDFEHEHNDDTKTTPSIDDNKSIYSLQNSIISRNSKRKSSIDERKSLSRQSQMLNIAERISMTDRKSIQQQQKPTSSSMRASKPSLSQSQQRDSFQRRSSVIDNRFSLVRVSRATLLSETMMADEDNNRPKLVIPAVFTPANQAGNAMFMYHFFRNLFDYFLPPEAEQDPEHILMAFQASKRHEIFELCEDYPKELLAFGFFTSEDFKTTKLICKTLKCYEKFADKKESDRLLMKVALRTDNFSLALTTMHIVYVSQNPVAGAKECGIVFNEEFMAAEDVEVEDEIVEPDPDDIRHRRRSSTKSTKRRSTKLRMSENL